MAVLEAELPVEVFRRHVVSDHLKVRAGRAAAASFGEDALYDRGGKPSPAEILADVDRIDADVVPVEYPETVAPTEPSGRRSETAVSSIGMAAYMPGTIAL